MAYPVCGPGTRTRYRFHQLQIRHRQHTTLPPPRHQTLNTRRPTRRQVRQPGLPPNYTRICPTPTTSTQTPQTRPHQGGRLHPQLTRQASQRSHIPRTKTNPNHRMQIRNRRQHKYNHRTHLRNLRPTPTSITNLWNPKSGSQNHPHRQ